MAALPDMPVATSKPRRRWFRYSLRTLWVFITLLAVGMAWVAHERSQSQLEHQVAEQLRANDATVTFVGRFDDPSREEQAWWRTSLNALLGTRVRSINANAPFAHAPIDLSPLAGLQNLQYLHLSFSDVRDISPLVGLTNLEQLQLNSTQVSDLAPLATLTKLQYLDLAHTHVSDISPLRALRTLKHLMLSGSDVRDLSALAHLKNLRTLKLDWTQVADLAPVAGLPDLEELDLEQSKVSNLAPLAGLKNLQSLGLERTPVNDEQVKSLQQALPNCEITR